MGRHTKDEYLTQVEVKVKESLGEAFHTLSKAQKIHLLRRAREALKEEAAAGSEDHVAEVKDLVAKTAERRMFCRTLMDETVPMRVESVQAVAAQLKSLKKYDFVKATASGQRVLASADELLAKIDRFNSTELKSLRRAVDYLSNASAPDGAADLNIAKLRRHAETLVERQTQVNRRLDALKDSAGRRIDGAAEMFGDMAIKTWVKNHPDAASEALNDILGGVDAALIMAKEFSGQYKPVVVAVITLKKTLVDRQVKAADAKRMVDEQKKNHTSDLGMQILADDPTIPAQRIAQKQKADFKQLLDALGFLGEYIPAGGWAAIADVLQGAAERYFDLPVEQLQRKLGTGGDPRSVAGQIAERAVELARTDNLVRMLSGTASGISGYIPNTAVGYVVDYAIGKIAERFPVDPAQEVSAGDLRDTLGELKNALKLNRAKYGLSEEVEDARRSHDRPTETSDGRKVLRVLQTDVESDGDGPFHWVDVEDRDEGVLMGKLRYSQDPAKRTFKAVDSAARSEAFPTEDKLGGKIDEIYHKAMKDGVNVGIEVRQGDLRGLLNANKIFIPQRPAGVSDWSDRIVDVREIRDATGVHKGEWFRLKGQNYMYFQHESGAREWAELESADKTGIKFVEKFRNNRLTATEIGDLAPYRG